MAMGKYSRVDGRKSSGYCSTVTIVMLVAFALIGMWMFTSSSFVPKPSLSSPVQNTDEVKQDFTKSVAKDSEDSSVGFPGDAKKEDDDEQSKYSENKNSENNNEDKSPAENTDENSEPENSSNQKQEESRVKENKEKRSDSNEGQKGEGEDGGNKEVGDSNLEAGETKEDSQMNKNEQNESDENSGENRSESAEGENDSKDQNVGENNTASQDNEQTSNEEASFVDQSELLKEPVAQNGSFSTQAAESQKEKSQKSSEYKWKTCKTTAGPDYIPCLDNWQAVKKLPSTNHYEHRERHCPDEAPICLVPLPEGYKRSIKWPDSRDKIWYHNVPHTKLAKVKGHQNWVKVTGEYLTFPGGGTQFKNGALHYIDFIQSSVPDIAWGKRTHVILDVGCGVASFGGFLFERDVLAMSFAPKDEHEAQVQFALERGIPAFLNVMGTKRLPFPSIIFDAIHCARCRVPWHIEGGKLLLELNRVLRPGGYFVWSATPVYQKLPEDVGIWQEMSRLTKKMCWELVTIKKDKLNGVGAAIYQKPMSNDCYDNRNKNDPPLCEESDDANAAWNVPLQACMHRVPVDSSQRGSQWPEQWPKRLEKPPYWLKSQVGIYGKAAPEDFVSDYRHWKAVVSESYLKSIGIDWSAVRNVMDMRATYGGFAAALKDLKVWVMNVVPVDSADTLAIIYERGLFGMYHDWCESFNTYPRTYDLLHADHIFSSTKKRCNLVTVFAEVDRILRPEGSLIVRDNAATIKEVERMARSLNWDVKTTYVQDTEGFMCFKKKYWRPNATEEIKAAIG